MYYVILRNNEYLNDIQYKNKKDIPLISAILDNPNKNITIEKKSSRNNKTLKKYYYKIKDNYSIELKEQKY